MRSDPATGLDWMATRAYDSTTGRFLSRDPLGRAPLSFSANLYVYAGNNPISNIDPSGQYRAAGFGSTQRESGQATNQLVARVQAVSGCGKACKAQIHSEWLAQVFSGQGFAQEKAREAANRFQSLGIELGIAGGVLSVVGAGLLASAFGAFIGQLFVWVGAALLTVSGAAFLIAHQFDVESQNSVGSSTSVGWFTWANIASQQDPVNSSVLGGIVWLAGGGGTIGGIVAAFIKVLELGGSEAELTDAATSLIASTAAGLFVGALLYGSIVAGSIAHFSVEVTTDLAEEERLAYE